MKKFNKLINPDYILGAHAPSKPHVQVLGRNELHVTWEPPEVPLGKINRYDLMMNNRAIYSGTEHSYTARRLIPDTEYNCVVSYLFYFQVFLIFVALKLVFFRFLDRN